MGSSLRDDEYPDPFALFVARKLRNPDDQSLTIGWLDHVEGHPRLMNDENAKNEEGGQIEPRE